MCRALTATRALWGLLLICAPGRLAAAIGAPEIDPRVRAVIRVLGAREMIQAMITAARPRPQTVWAGAAVDATHSGSMALLAVREPRYRRLAATSASISGALASIGVQQGLRSSPR